MRDRRNGSTSSKRILGFGAAVAVGLGLVISVGCTSSRSAAAYTRPLPPKPRPLQAAPPDARANALVVNVSAAPRDTNGNGYPDLIHATAHLFDAKTGDRVRIGECRTIAKTVSFVVIENIVKGE